MATSNLHTFVVAILFVAAFASYVEKTIKLNKYSRMLMSACVPSVGSPIGVLVNTVLSLGTKYKHWLPSSTSNPRS